MQVCPRGLTDITLMKTGKVTFQRLQCRLIHTRNHEPDGNAMKYQRTDLGYCKGGKWNTASR